MTERLLHDYPSLNITLYIGMTTHEGLSMKNHEGFLNLTNQYGERIKIMYQITQPPTHIKLYSWIKDGSYYTHFVGSANFSENGLFKLNELTLGYRGEGQKPLSRGKNQRSDRCLSGAYGSYAGAVFAG